MRSLAAALLSLCLICPAFAAPQESFKVAAQAGCLEPGDSDFVYPVGNIIKYCDDQRADNTCAKFMCTRCQASGDWSDDYVCSKPERPVR